MKKAHEDEFRLTIIKLYKNKTCMPSLFTQEYKFRYQFFFGQPRNRILHYVINTIVHCNTTCLDIVTLYT